MNDEPKPQPGLKLTVNGSGAANMRALEAIAPNPLPSEPLDVVTAEPVLTGEHGRAWSVHADRIAEAAGQTPDDHAGIGDCWLVEAPWAHPCWHSYLVMLIHLRPVPGMKPPKINLPGATHEIFVMAISPGDPGKPSQRQAFLDLPKMGTGGIVPLTPLNFAGQFIEASDDAAIARVRKAVQMIVDGRLSPDTDFVRVWAHLFSASNLKEGAGDSSMIWTGPDGQPLVVIARSAVPGPQDRTDVQ